VSIGSPRICPPLPKRQAPQQDEGVVHQPLDYDVGFAGPNYYFTTVPTS
jgi:hypothetical protein